MVSMLKATLKWSGFSGAPGYSNFFFLGAGANAPVQLEADAAANIAGNFGSYIRTYLPIEASLQVQSEVQQIKAETGELENIWNVGSKPVLQGQAASAPYSAASGLVVNWRTAGVRNGRRVRGRTFCVPLANTTYDAQGTIASAVMTSLNTNLATLIGGTNNALLGVYSRPSSKGATDGQWYQCTSFNIPDKVAVLRSRRD